MPLVPASSVVIPEKVRRVVGQRCWQPYGNGGLLQ